MKTKTARAKTARTKTTTDDTPFSQLVHCENSCRADLSDRIHGFVSEFFRNGLRSIYWFDLSDDSALWRGINFDHLMHNPLYAAEQFYQVLWVSNQELLVDPFDEDGFDRRYLFQPRP